MDLKASAYLWFTQGFNVVAVSLTPQTNGVYAKKPLCEWGKWVNQRQTQDEFDAQNWDTANGFGVVCSYPNNQGYYLAVVDFDVKNVGEDAKARGKQFLTKFLTTKTEETINKGIHLLYLSKVKPNPISTYHNSHALELIAGAKLCIMSPSEGYKTLNDNLPTVVEDAELLFYQVLGVKDEREKVNEGLSDDLLQKWLNELKPKLSIAGEGNNYFYVHCPFHKPDKTPSFAIHKTKFYAIDYHDGKVYSLKSLGEALSAKLGETDGEEEANLFCLAKEIVSKSPVTTDIRTYLMYRWNGKIWFDDAEGYIHKRLIEVEDENYKPYHLTTLTQIVQGLTFTHNLEEPSPNLLCFENGILDLDTLELQPHNPKYFFRNIIHANFCPNAKATKFLKWLNEVLPDEESQILAQEIFGYCFYRDYPLHYIFFLVGTGRNGKGVFTRTLEGILGRESCSNIPFERLCERFQTTNLIGKLANVVSEPDIKRIPVETVKTLTGQDLISAEFKGKQKFVNFTNYAKLVISANRLPPVNDKSVAWWERVIILEFPITIEEEKRIPNIEATWLSDDEERSGIVNWALGGLKRLLQNKRFTKSKKMAEMIEEYKRWSNPVDYFLEKQCEYLPNSWVTKKELYDTYKDFCEAEGLTIVSEELFSKEIRKKPRVTAQQKRIDEKRVWVWVGLRFKPSDDKGSDDKKNDDEGDAVTSGTGGTSDSILRKACESVVGEERKENLDNNKIPVPLVPLVTKPNTFFIRAFELQQVVGCKPLTLMHIGTCAFCGVKPATLTHTVKTFDAYHFVCEKCAGEITAFLKREVEKP